MTTPVPLRDAASLGWPWTDPLAVCVIIYGEGFDALHHTSVQSGYLWVHCDDCSVCVTEVRPN